MRLCLAILIASAAALTGCNSRPNTDGKVPMSKENLIKANRGLVTIDRERIEAFAERHQWEMGTTETGLWYQIYEHGTGDSARNGLIASLKYTVSLLDGTQCYSSDSTGEKTFLIGQGGVESGLEQGVLMLRVGDKARFIMPPHLAHGLPGDNNKIPARSTIVYQVELLNLTDCELKND